MKKQKKLSPIMQKIKKIYITTIVVGGVILFWYSFFGPTPHNNLAKKERVDIYNNEVLTNHIQGKWSGNTYSATVQGNKKWDVRLLIEGKNIHKWQKLSDGHAMGKVNWSQVNKNTVSYYLYTKKKGKWRELFYDNGSLWPKIEITPEGYLMYGRERFDRGW